MGFNESGHTVPNYWWGIGSKKFHRSKFMKHLLVKDGADPKMSESQIMKSRGYFKIYGAGNIKYELILG